MGQKSNKANTSEAECNLKKENLEIKSCLKQTPDDVVKTGVAVMPDKKTNQVESQPKDNSADNGSGANIFNQCKSPIDLVDELRSGWG